MNFSNERLEVEVKLYFAHKIGKKVSLVKLDSFYKKLMVMKNKEKINVSGIGSLH